MLFDKWVDDNRNEIIEKTQGVLRIDSVGQPASGDNQPFGTGCAEALDYVLNLGREMGCEVKNVDGYAGHIEYGEGDDYIAVVAHLDVVPVGPGWSHPPFGAEIHDGKIYARGAIDDKGPGMAGLFALKAVKESGLPLSKKVRVIFGVDEESNWRCMEHYFQKEPLPAAGFTPDAEFPLIYAEKGILCFNAIRPRKNSDSATVVVRELTGGSRVNMVPDICQVTLEVRQGEANTVAEQLRQSAESHNTQAEVEVNGNEIALRVNGVSAHGAMPHVGVNAIVKAGELLAELDTADRDLWNWLAEIDTEGERVGVKLHCDVTGPLTCNLGVAKVGDEQAVFTFNLRFPVKETNESMFDHLRTKLGPEGFSVEQSDDISMKPLYVPKESDVVQKLLGVYREATGDETEPITIGGGTYARAIPNAVAFGALFPGQEELAHQKDENWAVEDLIKCTKIYAQAIYELAK
ncbi:MAG TPA: dipeptidase PepV [Bacilli bacterium]|nr:dipeptidase PepV [Bacilli bacterium]